MDFVLWSLSGSLAEESHDPIDDGTHVHIHVITGA